MTEVKVGQRFHQSKDFAVLQVEAGTFCRVHVRMDGSSYIFPALVFPDRVMTFPSLEGIPAQAFVEAAILEKAEESLGKSLPANPVDSGPADYVPVEEKRDDQAAGNP